VTGGALQFFVCAIELVVGVNVVVKSDNGPSVSDMAGITGLTEQAIMVIVFEVARDAAAVQVVGEGF